ncbi:MAG: ABC transporter substrate-binding protein [Deinococcota bacterium]
MKQHRQLVISLITGLMFVTGLSFAQQDTVTIGIGAEPLTLLGSQAVDWTTAAQIENVYDTLLRRDPETLETIPWLATSYTVVDDNTFELTLREDVTFHNGEPFDAEAVKFTFDYVLNPDNGSMWEPRFNRISEVEIIDDFTVRILTSEPFPVLLDNLAGTDIMILAPDYVAEVGIEEASRAPVGTGPYRFVEWVRGESLSLTRNDDYWAGAAAIENVEFRVIPEFGSRLSALLAGEIDIMKDVPPQVVETVNNAPDTEVRSTVSARINYLAFQTLIDSPVQDVRVREALTYAIDVDELIASVHRGEATKICSYTSRTDPSYNNDIPCLSPDLERARELLAEAGYAPEDLTLQLDTPSGRYPLDREVSVAIAAQLERLGVNVEVQVNEWRAHLDAIVNRQTGDMFFLGWGAILEPVGTIPQLFRDSQSYASFGTPDITEAIDTAIGVVQPDERFAAFSDVQAMLAEESPWMPLWQQHDLYGVATWLDWAPRADEKLWMWEAGIAE